MKKASTPKNEVPLFIRLFFKKFTEKFNYLKNDIEQKDKDITALKSSLDFIEDKEGKAKLQKDIEDINNKCNLVINFKSIGKIISIEREFCEIKKVFTTNIFIQERDGHYYYLLTAEEHDACVQAYKAGKNKFITSRSITEQKV
jgi:hypothetical protein